MRVALVDPSLATRMIVARLLKGRGHDVAQFARTDDALEAIKSDSEISGVITSAESSPISGLELCWEVRLVAGHYRPMYILLMTSHSDPRRGIEALDCGADDLITKPPRPDDLYAKLRVAERIVSLQRDLIELATTDPLTGVYNRRAFFAKAIEACKDTEAKGPLSAILLDIDRFKAINDHYGHDVGDEVVRAVATEIAVHGTLVGRLGGDEFGILLKGITCPEAVTFAEDLRQRISALKMELPEIGTIQVTCSLGASEFQRGDTIDDLLKRADLALYRAKDEGRNRVATPPSSDWMSESPHRAVSVVRSLARRPLSEPKIMERRSGLPPSDALLARVCAGIDLLTRSGIAQETAAEVMMEKMRLAGLRAPNAQGTTDWQRLLAWRNDLVQGRTSAESRGEYEYFTAEIEAIPPHDRVECVLKEGLWDRRREKQQRDCGAR